MQSCNDVSFSAGIMKRNRWGLGMDRVLLSGSFTISGSFLPQYTPTQPLVIPICSFYKNLVSNEVLKRMCSCKINVRLWRSHLHRYRPFPEVFKIV